MINATSITDREKLTIAKGLCDYCYIMANWQRNDADFKEVYYAFYLKARWAVMRLPENRDPYFAQLQNIDPDDDFMGILDSLKTNMAAESYEFSLGSKLLHTRNPQKPIYDQKVREYLANEEGVDFWWQHSPRVRGVARGFTERQK